MIVHEIAEKHGIVHESKGESQDRFVSLTKRDQYNVQEANALMQTMNPTKAEVEVDAQEITSEHLLTPESEGSTYESNAEQQFIDENENEEEEEGEEDKPSSTTSQVVKTTPKSEKSGNAKTKKKPKKTTSTTKSDRSQK